MDSSEQKYKKYFENHGKKFEDGPFKIIPPNKQKPKTKQKIQPEKSVEIQEVPKPIQKIPSKKDDFQSSYNNEFRKCSCLGYAS